MPLKMIQLHIASSWDGNIKVIPYKDNRQNFSEGCNFLFNAASPADNDYVMLLNNDVIFQDKESIKNMLSIIQKDNSVGMVGARLLYTDTDLLQHAGVIFDPTYKTPMHFVLVKSQTMMLSVTEPSKWSLARLALPRRIITAMLLRRINLVLKGMDENYYWAFDDVDLCLSIKYNLNKKIVYCGNTNIFHEESGFS